MQQIGSILRNNIHDSNLQTETIENGNSLIRTVLRGQKIASDIQIDIDYIEIPAKTITKQSIHSTFTEIFFFLSTGGKIYLDNIMHNIKQGDTIVVKKNTKHYFHTKDQLCFLAMCIPKYDSSDEIWSDN